MPKKRGGKKGGSIKTQGAGTHSITIITSTLLAVRKRKKGGKGRSTGKKAATPKVVAPQVPPIKVTPVECHQISSVKISIISDVAKQEGGEGVKVTIHYTTDGSDPTADFTENIEQVGICFLQVHINLIASTSLGGIQEAVHLEGMWSAHCQDNSPRRRLPPQKVNRSRCSTNICKAFLASDSCVAVFVCVNFTDVLAVTCL